MKRIEITGTGSRMNSYESNRGNMAIMRPMVKQLQDQFPDVQLSTDIPLPEAFLERHNIEYHSSPRVLSRPGYDDLRSVFSNLIDCSTLSVSTYLDGVGSDGVIHRDRIKRYDQTDLLLSFNGDTFPTKTSFNVCLEHASKILIAKKLNVPVFEFAGSPGPFEDLRHRWLGKYTFNREDLISTREPISTRLLKDLGIETPIVSGACPAFLLESVEGSRVDEILSIENVPKDKSPIVGVTLTGYNLPSTRNWNASPSKNELELFQPSIRYFLEEIDAHVVLIPHAYRWNEVERKLTQGNDSEILGALYSEFHDREHASDISFIEGIYTAPELKGLIGELDFFLSGRLHAGAAGLSQGVPTALLAYGHKHYGFAELYDQESYICDGEDPKEILDIVASAWEDRDGISEVLEVQHNEVVDLAMRNFEVLGELVDAN